MNGKWPRHNTDDVLDSLSTLSNEDYSARAWPIFHILTRLCDAAKFRSWRVLVNTTILIPLVTSALISCGAPPTYNWNAERAAGYKVGPGDVLRINVWKHDELSQAGLTVRPDGGLSLPLVGEVSANGRTVDEIATEIASRLEKYYQDRPPVTVQLTDVRSYKVYVLGEVNRGGEFTPNHQINVLHGIALAGGFTRFANPARVIIIRRDARGERRIPFDYHAVVEQGDLQQNLALQSGDTVIVP